MSPVPKADHLRTELISDALTTAIATRDPRPTWSSTPTALLIQGSRLHTSLGKLTPNAYEGDIGLQTSEAAA